MRNSTAKRGCQCALVIQQYNNRNAIIYLPSLVLLKLIALSFLIFRSFLQKEPRLTPRQYDAFEKHCLNKTTDAWQERHQTTTYTLLTRAQQHVPMSCSHPCVCPVIPTARGCDNWHRCQVIRGAQTFLIHSVKTSIGLCRVFKSSVGPGWKTPTRHRTSRPHCGLGWDPAHAPHTARTPSQASTSHLTN